MSRFCFIVDIEAQGRIVGLGIYFHLKWGFIPGGLHWDMESSVEFGWVTKLR